MPNKKQNIYNEESTHKQLLKILMNLSETVMRERTGYIRHHFILGMQDILSKIQNIFDKADLQLMDTKNYP